MLLSVNSQLPSIICGPWIRAKLLVKEGASRKRKLHPRCKDPSFLKYLVTVNLLKATFSYELCVACEQKGVAKCYFKSSHKCKCGGTPDSTHIFLNCLIVYLFRPPTSTREVGGCRESN